MFGCAAIRKSYSYCHSKVTQNKILLNLVLSRSVHTSVKMDNISDVKLTPLTESKYIRPQRILYNQNGTNKIWDAMKVHDSVAILIHNVTRNVFVMVKQFRPAVYITKASIEDKGDGMSVIDHEKNPGALGITHELCAGIVDKDLSNVQIAKEEVLEETGYDVPLERLEKITSQRSVGTSGALQTIYYTTVTDDMKVNDGGGCLDEGEFIETTEIPVDSSLEFAMDENITKPMGMVFAVLWYHHFKAKK